MTSSDMPLPLDEVVDRYGLEILQSPGAIWCLKTAISL